MYLGYKEQKCIVLFLTMQQTKRNVLTAMALYNCYEAMVVRRHPLVYCKFIGLFLAGKVAYSVLLKLFRIWFQTSLLITVIYSGVSILLLFYLFQLQKILHPVETILPHSALHHINTTTLHCQYTVNATSLYCQ